MAHCTACDKNTHTLGITEVWDPRCNGYHALCSKCLREFVTERITESAEEISNMDDEELSIFATKVHATMQAVVALLKDKLDDIDTESLG